MMATRTCRVGLHGRNQEFFEEVDYRIIREAHIETLKMMSLTHPDVFRRIKDENPGIEFIVRLFDDRFGTGHHPTPEQFAERMVPVMERLRPFATKFEIHNEPNHLQRYEGWGQDDADARDFNGWYQNLFKMLKQRCPWALLGFPGLAIPHRDLEWAEVCRPAIEMSDFLGVHCYWQTTPQEPRNHLADFWGLRFKYYHQKFPNKIIDLLEVGNSNAQSGLPISDLEIAQQYVEYFQELFKYPYLNSASPFILSSPDPTWDSFAWRKSSGEVKSVAALVGGLSRPPLSMPAVKPVVRERFFETTRQTVKGPFLDFLERVGLEICGYPISPAAEEDGLLVQYFQQVIMEEFQPGKIRLRQAGALVLELRQRLRDLETSREPERRTTRAVANPSIQDVSRSLAKHATDRYATRTLSQISRIVMHHSAVPANVGAAQIAKYQVEKQGWPGAGFHYFIYTDGRIEQTQPLEIVAYHAGDANPASVGICLAGNFTDQPPPEAQMRATSHLVAWLLQEFDLSTEAISPHKDYAATACPGRQWDTDAKWGARLRQQVQDRLAGAGPAPAE